MKKSIPLNFFLICLYFFQVTGAGAACLTPAEQQALWNEAVEALKRTSRVVYSNGSSSLPEYPGYITPSEFHYYTLDDIQKNEPADLHVGFGSLINFNILGIRKGSSSSSALPSETTETSTSSSKVRTAIFADQSREVIISLMSFWRPLWLASETPEEWLAQLAQIDLQPNQTIDDLFSNIRGRQRAQEHLSSSESECTQTDCSVDPKDVASARDSASSAAVLEPSAAASSTKSTEASFLSRKRLKLTLPQRVLQKAPNYEPSFKVLSDLDQKLRRLESQNHISATDRRFAMTLMEQEYQGCPSIFEDSRNSSGFANLVLKLYSLDAQSEDLIARRNAARRELGHFESLFDLSDEATQRADQAFRAKIFSTSFLYNRENYNRVRQIFLEGHDFYAITKLQNSTFWDHVRTFAEQRSLNLTDIYASCIMRGYRRDDPGIYLKLRGSLSSIPGEVKFLFESTCTSYQPKMIVQNFYRNHGSIFGFLGSSSPANSDGTPAFSPYTPSPRVLRESSAPAGQQTDPVAISNFEDALKHLNASR